MQRYIWAHAKHVHVFLSVSYTGESSHTRGAQSNSSHQDEACLLLEDYSNMFESCSIILPPEAHNPPAPALSLLIGDISISRMSSPLHLLHPLVLTHWSSNTLPGARLYFYLSVHVFSDTDSPTLQTPPPPLNSPSGLTLACQAQQCNLWVVITEVSKEQKQSCGIKEWHFYVRPFPVFCTFDLVVWPIRLR